MSKNFNNGALSSFLLVIESLLQKLVGLASTLVLARVLLPEDFGIIAIATIMIGFISVLSNTGSHQYLMRVDSLDDDKVNTAWSITLIIQTILSALMIMSSFYIADFYGDVRLSYVLITLSLVFFVKSFLNPGLAFLKRAQNYQKIVKLTVIAKLCSATAAVLAALILKSYWALVIGEAVSTVIMTIGSHVIYKHKLKFNFTNAVEQWQFSSWMIPQSIFGYFRTQLDTFLVSSSFGQATLGSYHTIKYIAFIPSQDIIVPVGKPFLVELANSKGSKPYFTKQIKASLILLMLIGLPITVIMYFHHALITSVLLGKNWAEYSYLMAAFGLLIPSFILAQQATRILLVFAKTKQLFFAQCLTFVSVYSVVLTYGINDIKSFSFLLAGMENIVSLAFFLVVLVKYTGFKSSVSFIFSIFPLIFGSVTGKLFSDLLIVEGLHAFWQLVLITGGFLTSFLLTMTLMYHLGFKRFAEWEYLMGLILRLTRPLIKKFARR